MATAIFGAGCFWGIEVAFVKVKGVTSTSVGYTGGGIDNPTYEQVCTGETNHAEVVWVEFNPSAVSYEELLDVFWGCHDPTTLNRQGPDRGTQYRSVIYFADSFQEAAAIKSKEQNSGRFQSPIVTEITAESKYYIAEDYHQQYLAKRGLENCH
ncbi:MAG TPA: peptide-methionine (S)-S-oxide reductase MsrA [Nitrospinae bacterium]|jgi:peptide-methionine (S)-S-oxide reductase|nr:peptide-methionine (S)-S-oxide reductase MsrA [Nitrospinota bacterium]